jgi:hypothetical protein
MIASIAILLRISGAAATILLPGTVYSFTFWAFPVFLVAVLLSVFVILG